MSASIPKKIVHLFLKKGETFTTHLTAGAHELIADEPTNVPGGADLGPDPYDYLLMSLGACTLMTVKMYADRKKWSLGNMYLEMRHHKNHHQDCTSCEHSDAKIDVIEKELIIEGELSDEQRDKLMEISGKCPVHRTLLGELDIRSSLSER